MITFLKKIFRLLPSQTPEFIYTKILKPKPLLKMANWLILRIIPENITLPSGRILFFNKKDPVISCALALDVYEKFETELFKREIKPGMTVIDVGANIGYYTIMSADMVGPTGKVICVEPDSQSVEMLKKNIEANKFNNIECINKALSDKEGVVGFYSSVKNRADNRIYDPGDGRVYTEIKTTTLDKILSPDTKIDFLKIDIQGAEALAIDGMKESIGRSGKMTLFTEFWPSSIEKTGRSAEKFLQKLIAFGFELYNIDDVKKKLDKITDLKSFSEQYKGREFTNIIGYKKS